MKRPLAFMVLLLALPWFAGLTFPTSEQDKLPMPTKFATHHLVLLKKGASPEANISKEEFQKLQVDHVQYQLRLLAEGRSMSAGPFASNNDGFQGATLLKTASLEEARHLASDDPLVKAGYLIASVYTWNTPAE
jgi:hypothetical protein